MKIIDLYIARKFLVTFIFTIFLFIFIAVVFDFAEKIDDFLATNAPLKKVIFDYYLNFIPYFINLFSPLFIFISAVFFTSRMAYNTEFIALLSAGTNFYRLLKPYLLVAAILTSLSWYLNNFIIPRSNEKLILFEEVYIKKPYYSGRGLIHRQVSPDVFIFLRNYNNFDSSGSRFSLEKFDGVRLKYKLMAQRIKWVESKKKWMVTNYTIRTFNGMKESLKKGDTTFISILMTPKDFGQKNSNMQIMTTPELRNYIREERLRGEELIISLQIERFRRTSMPFATFILVLIAFSISSRRLRGGTGMHLGLGILVAFSYIFFMQFSTVFATRGNVDPLISVWIPNIIFAVLGIVMLRLAPK
ncbi:MAG TPA: LptF/LptG family permease [Bacteroidia bacterium]|nr:YjgP/YjgQ family permease [Sphingobacteriales bacterium]HPD64961.1 LptF/LptG family permease [Bacteroidia bacterium]HRS58165.1 LptF/LptG family permease [Bacteroidia bacterium]HRU67495.1 LptF/LptG family permease [Bacteroidia bacterium]